MNQPIQSSKGCKTGYCRMQKTRRQRQMPIGVPLGAKMPLSVCGEVTSMKSPFPNSDRP